MLGVAWGLERERERAAAEKRADSVDVLSFKTARRWLMRGSHEEVDRPDQAIPQRGHPKSGDYLREHGASRRHVGFGDLTSVQKAL